MSIDNALVRDNTEILRQGLDLLLRLDHVTYRTCRHTFSPHGIGSHFRHCLDFYGALLSGLDERRIDYDARQRDRRIEIDRGAAIVRLEAVLLDLAGLQPCHSETPLLVKTETSPGENGPSSWSRSSLKRELQFLLSHSVHHYALIAVMLRLSGIEVPDEFGVAPSTLQSWRESAACAR